MGMPLLAASINGSPNPSPKEAATTQDVSTHVGPNITRAEYGITRAGKSTARAELVCERRECNLTHAEIDMLSGSKDSCADVTAAGAEVAVKSVGAEDGVPAPPPPPGSGAEGASPFL